MCEQFRENRINPKKAAAKINPGSAAGPGPANWPVGRIIWATLRLYIVPLHYTLIRKVMKKPPPLSRPAPAYRPATATSELRPLYGRDPLPLTPRGGVRQPFQPAPVSTMVISWKMFIRKKPVTKLSCFSMTISVWGNVLWYRLMKKRIFVFTEKIKKKYLSFYFCSFVAAFY